MLNNKELAALLRTYHAAKVAADKAKALGEQIKAEAAERGVDKLEAGGFIATVKAVTSTTFDSKAFKAADPETWEQFAKTSTTTRLYFK